MFLRLFFLILHALTCFELFSIGDCDPIVDLFGFVIVFSWHILRSGDFILRLCKFVWKLMRLWCFWCVIMDLFKTSMRFLLMLIYLVLRVMILCHRCVIVINFVLDFFLLFMDFSYLNCFLYLFVLIKFEFWFMNGSVCFCCNSYENIIFVEFFLLHEQRGFLNISYWRIVFRVCNCLVVGEKQSGAPVN